MRLVTNTLGLGCCIFDCPVATLSCEVLLKLYLVSAAGYFSSGMTSSMFLEIIL